MGKCAVKKGIFVNMECGKPSSIKCDDCGIFICDKHTVHEGPKVLCPDCYAKAHAEVFEGTKRPKNKQSYKNFFYNDYFLWYYGTRRNYYNHYGYSPFNREEYNSFVQGNDRDFSDDQDSGSFFDS